MMKVQLYPFQENAVNQLRNKIADSVRSYQSLEIPQVISLQAPTGAGKTIIMAALIEDIFHGNEMYVDQPNAVIVWLSDSPSLNEQSRQKISLKADKLREGQFQIIEESSFNQETLDDGKIYFLNTQKIGKGAKLNQHGNGRQYTIWETIANTIEEKSDRLYFVIDEAHRGMQGQQAGEATSIMQRFLIGAPKLGMPKPVPIVIGMSATADRFLNLVGNISSALHRVIISTDDVRASGLLKDRIIIKYPEDNERHNDIAVLQAAVEEWKNKCIHWYQYTQEQHYANVNPILIVQVKAGTDSKISNTDLDVVISKIEEQLGERFKEFEVAHTFGGKSDITMNGLVVHYIAPEEIVDDRRIRVVLFKENLSTGWDCPRAETMMSFRKAEDSTYIAQLLGRMIRTPLQMHVLVDDYLNDVRLFLPYFNEETVQKVIDELQNAEGGDLPTVIDGEPMGNGSPQIWRSSNPNSLSGPQNDLGITNNNPMSGSNNVSSIPPVFKPIKKIEYNTSQTSNTSTSTGNPLLLTAENSSDYSTRPADINSLSSSTANKSNTNNSQADVVPKFDRDDVRKFINESNFTTYTVRKAQIHNYLRSLYDLASLLTIQNLYPKANDEIIKDIIDLIHNYADNLRQNGTYESMKKKVLEMKLSVRIFDVFGEDNDKNVYQDLFMTNSDLEQQLRNANSKMGGRGIPNSYISRFINEGESVDDAMIDCILFAAEEKCMDKLYNYAKDKFNKLDDEYRKYIVYKDEACQIQYDKITANSDAVTKHSFRIHPEVGVKPDDDGKTYYKHLFYTDVNTFSVKIKLGAWEEGVLEEENARPDFVCWLRNIPRKSWSFTIPYEIKNVKTPMYPDFLIVRSDPVSKYVVDILEPHDSSRKDNYNKIIGLAKYAKREKNFGRIQLIRLMKNSVGRNKFCRLDLAVRDIREQVFMCKNNDDIDILFDKYGDYDEYLQ